MNNISIECEIKNGKMVIDGIKFKDLVSTLPDGRAMLTVEMKRKPHSIDDCRKHYFGLRDSLFTHGNTGYTVNELHVIIKQGVLPLIPIEERYFNLEDVDIQDLKNPQRISTKWLTLEGWNLFLKYLKSFAFENFNVYL